MIGDRLARVRGIVVVPADPDLPPGIDLPQLSPQPPLERPVETRDQFAHRLLRLGVVDLSDRPLPIRR